MQEKKCAGCKEVKSVTDFYKCKNGTYGVQGKCKACQKAHRQANAEKSRAYAKKSRERNPETYKAYQEANKEYKAEYMRNYQARTREDRLAQARKYFAEHRDERMEYMREYYVANREEHSERTRQYRLEHPEVKRKSVAKRRALNADAFVEFVDYMVVYERDNGLCGICCSDIPVAPEDFHLDHIIPISRGGLHSYVNTQTSHSWCNLAKGNNLPEELDGRFLVC